MDGTSACRPRGSSICEAYTYAYTGESTNGEKSDRFSQVEILEESHTRGSHYFGKP